MRRTGKKLKYTYVKVTLIVLFCYALLGRGYVTFAEEGENFFHIQLNGEEVGILGDIDLAQELLREARKNVAIEGENLVFIEAELSYIGEQVLWGKVDDERMVEQNMEAVLRNAIQETMHHSYTVKVDEYTVNLASAEDVRTLLQAAVDRYDLEDEFEVELIHDSSREFNVMTAQVVNKKQREETEQTKENALFAEGGFEAVVTQTIATASPQEEMDFEDYERGILSLDFSEDVEIVEAYLPLSQLTPVEEAIEEVTKEQEMKTIYTVVSGDTLTEIAIKVNIPMDQIIAMNDTLEDENTVLHIGDELVITVPEPELSITWQEENYYEETYDADVVYIDNDSWYTNHTEVRRQPSSGFRKIVAISTYENEILIDREIVKEEIVWEAVAKVVERGTKTPPTYIKPLNGGIKTSGFGYRNVSYIKGATNNHKGVDWATPVGTPIFASCGGTVAKAGWGSGYGYVVYINHEDGSQTRYAHLSKVLVKVGQTVKQGERIALSGNTGVTSGPHVHFEILINNKQVNPLDYVK